MVLIRLKVLGILDDNLMGKFKIEKTIWRLLNDIEENVDLCKKAEVKKVPDDYLDGIISNYILTFARKTTFKIVNLIK